LLCTSLLVGERWPVASKVLADYIRQSGVKIVCYDYEFSTVTGPHSCYCDRCLAAFREEAGFSAEEPLTPRVIENAHRTAWDTFMVRRGARLLGLMRKTVNEAGATFTVFSLPQSPRTVSVYGVDWREVVREQGADVIQIGTSGTWQQMLQSSEAAGSTPIMYGVWIIPYSPKHMIPAAVATRAELLRRVLDSTYGIIFYDRATMDGRSWWNVGETTRLVADFEDLFLHSRPEPVQGQDPEQVQWVRGKEKQLLCLMNPGNAPAYYTIPLPSGVANGYKYYTRASVSGSTLEITVPPHDTAVYVFDRQ